METNYVDDIINEFVGGGQEYLDVIENDFFNKDYLDEEIGDDIFLIMASQFSENAHVFVTHEHHVVDGREVSLFHYINHEQDRIEVGPKNVEKTSWSMTHDFLVVDPVLTWFVDSDFNHISREFPYVRQADPLIDKTNMENEKEFWIQSFFMRRGYSLYRPTYGEIIECATFGGMVSDAPLTDFEVPEDTTDQTFHSYKDIEKGYDKKYIAMQFNPIHPMAQHMIVSIERKDNMVYEGEYRYRGKVIPFRYDMRDDRFRMHSDMWCAAVDTSSHNDLVFDLVSNHDFRHIFSPYKPIISDDELKGYCPVKLEPFYTTRYPDWYYSVIGPWEGDLSPGYGSIYILPYLTKRFHGALKGERYRDISANCEFFEANVLVRCRYHKYCTCKGREQYVFYGNEQCFFFHKAWKRAYVLSHQEDDGDLIYVRFPGRVLSTPTDGKKSLIYPYQFLNLLSLYGICNKDDIIQYLPLGISKYYCTLDIREKIIQYDLDTVMMVQEMEESLSKESIIKEKSNVKRAVHIDRIDFFRVKDDLKEYQFKYDIIDDEVICNIDNEVFFSFEETMKELSVSYDIY